MIGTPIAPVLNAHRDTLTEVQGVAAAVFTGFEKLVVLNLSATRSIWIETADDFFASCVAVNPRDALAAHASLVKPLLEKSISYGRSVTAITFDTGMQLGRAVQHKLADNRNMAVTAAESVVQQAPCGSRWGLSALKATSDAGKQVFDAMGNATQRVVDVAQQRASAATDTALRAVKTSSAKRPR